MACELPPILTPGEYTISVWLGTAYENLEQHEDVVAFSVEGDDLGRAAPARQARHRAGKSTESMVS